MKRDAHSISIVRKNFGKKNSAAALILVSLFSLMGLMGLIIDWKSGLCGIVFVALLYLIYRIVQFQYFIWFIISSLIAAYFLSEWLEIAFLQLVITSVCISFIFLIKPYYNDYIKPDDFEIFYLDRKQLRCLATFEDGDYKGYAINPKNYLKRYETVQIKGITCVKNHITIAVGDLLVRPRELSVDDVDQIWDYLNIHFPTMLDQKDDMQRNKLKENRYYMHKFFIFSPVIILAPIIYFFGNNGSDKRFTYCCLLLMILLPIIISKSLRKKNKA